jgi:AmmeMemoRadiSam system protein B
MRNQMFLLSVLAIVALLATSVAGSDPTVKELLDGVGIKPSGGGRGQMDTIGFVTTARQMDGVTAQCLELAVPRQRALEEQHGWTDETRFVAGVCPHDDYYYAGRLYPLLLSRIKAKTVILFGVFHKARVFDLHDKLIFDSFETWHGPYGPVTVSPLREEIIKRLPSGDYVIDNDMQMVEHSVEAIVPWLQAFNRDVEIISILVPYMQWDTMDRLAAELSGVIEQIIRDKNLTLGKDVCLVASADAIHYGDSGWGGSNYAEFGTDVEGYKNAVKRDLRLAQDYLCGPVERGKLEQFLYTCVDSNDVMKYKVTWCGRFSVPFGLNVASRLVEALEDRTLEGTLLDYGTSVSEASLDTQDLEGLGVTAPNNFRHFVGYAAIGYQ